MVNLGRCNGSCNGLDDLFDKRGFPNTAEDGNVKIYNVITRRNDKGTKIIIKTDKKCTSNQKW